MWELTMPIGQTEVPDSGREVLGVGDLQDRGLRERLSPGAVRLFLALARQWELNVDDRRVLLGGISAQTYHNWRKGKVAALTRDQLERISLLLGIHKGLKLIFADDAAGKRWLTSANRDFPFGNRAPLARALDGGINDLYAVRRYLDAWRGVK
jgi:hypothetical protein